MTLSIQKAGSHYYYLIIQLINTSKTAHCFQPEFKSRQKIGDFSFYFQALNPAKR